MKNILHQFLIFFALLNPALGQEINWTFVADQVSQTYNSSITTDGNILVNRGLIEKTVALINPNGELLWEQNICNCSDKTIIRSVETISGEIIHLSREGFLYKTTGQGNNSELIRELFHQFTNPNIKDSKINNGVLSFAGNAMESGIPILFRGEINLDNLTHVVFGEPSDLFYISFSKTNDNRWIEILSTQNTKFVNIHYNSVSTVVDSFISRISDVEYFDDENIIIAGTKSTDFFNRYGYLRSITIDGQLNYEKLIPSNNGLGAHAFAEIKILEDRILVGGTKSDTQWGNLYLAEIDLDGNISSEFSKELTLSEDHIGTILSDSNGNIFLTGDLGRSDLADPLRSYVISLSGVLLNSQEFSHLDLTIYPNPSGTTLSIESDFGTAEKLAIFNLSGKKVKEQVGNKINVEELASGSYFIKIYIDDWPVTKKVVVLNSQ